MDESWRIPKPPAYPHRQPTGNGPSRRRNPVSGDPENFPEILLPHHFSTAVSTTSYLYPEVFQPLETVVRRRSGRSLPVFKIPGRSHRETNGFYGDIFGSCYDERSKRSTSFSSDELPVFASNFRWNSTGMVNEENPTRQKSPYYPSGSRSPETISLKPISNGRYRGLSTVSAPDSSSMYQQGKATEIEEEISRQGFAMEEDEEAMSPSYVIEINSDWNVEGTTSESNGVDEAIAWAKEKYQTHCSKSQESDKTKQEQEILNAHQHSEGQKYSSDLQVQTEMRILDEKIKLWSLGKETDIRLLLTSLHYILWPNSGWLAVPLTKLIEVSQVKKAYQRARLCLHPDKLQQRGATPTEKYIAERVFSLLQDAWDAFNARDVFCR